MTKNYKTSTEINHRDVAPFQVDGYLPYQKIAKKKKKDEEEDTEERQKKKKKEEEEEERVIRILFFVAIDPSSPHLPLNGFSRFVHDQ